MFFIQIQLQQRREHWLAFCCMHLMGHLPFLVILVAIALSCIAYYRLFYDEQQGNVATARIVEVDTEINS